jgi:hypothetical protein
LIKSQYDQEVINFLRSMPGAGWDGNKKKWKMNTGLLWYFMEMCPYEYSINGDIPIESKWENRGNLIVRNNDHCIDDGFLVVRPEKTNSENDVYYGLHVEGKFFRDPTTKRSKALLRLCKQNSYKPVNVYYADKDELYYKAPRGLFTALNILHHPIGINLHWFENRYCDPKPTTFTRRDVSGQSNFDEFQDRIRGIITFN